MLFIWVIENICKNAADAMKGKGIISISCDQNDQEIEIYISDTGKGIENADAYANAKVETETGMRKQGGGDRQSRPTWMH